MRIFITFIALFFLGCSYTLSKDQLTQINGYWEIEKVVLSDGFEKEYKMSTMVDYFMMEDMLGYRKKVQPVFDGTFDTSDDAQPFEVKQTGDTFELYYKNELTEWMETIESLDESRLILSNNEGVKYYYKKFEPLTPDVK